MVFLYKSGIRIPIRKVLFFKPRPFPVSDTERFINVLTKVADARLTYKQLIK